jgi:hypothetical protein
MSTKDIAEQLGGLIDYEQELMSLNQQCLMLITRLNESEQTVCRLRNELLEAAKHVEEG